MTAAEDIQRVANVLHELQCNDFPECGRWDNLASAHQAYYRGRASNIITLLEPEIGMANVVLAVGVILDEVS